MWSEVVTDEFTWSDFAGQGGNIAYQANVDARQTAPFDRFLTTSDNGWQNVLQSRASMLLAVPLLEQYEPAAGQSKIGEAFALMGYAELLLAEDFCAGTTLDQVLPAGKGYVWGTPLTTDSLLAVAEAHFDSALLHAHGDATVDQLTRVGLGRTLLNRNRADSAAVVTASVPTGFVYNTDLPTTYNSARTTNVYAFMITNSEGYPGANGAEFMRVADREGANGLDFVSAVDPRVVIDSSLGQTPDGITWYVPAKFEGSGMEYIPLATGVEARLIQAEAALRRGDIGGWASTLNALRADAPDTKVTFPPATQSITTDSTTLASATMRIDVMFRERAFWLFGTGARLGDLRRLIRQYGRDQSTVFPSGPYANGHDPHLPTPLPTYGTDVSLTPPIPTSGNVVANPNFKGCISHGA
jgi:hypothetical protein